MSKDNPLAGSIIYMGDIISSVWDGWEDSKGEETSESNGEQEGKEEEEEE